VASSDFGKIGIQLLILIFSGPQGLSPSYPFRDSGDGVTEQFRGINPNGGGECGNLGIGDAADLAFESGDVGAAYVPSGDIQLGGKAKDAGSFGAIGASAAVKCWKS